MSLLQTAVTLQDDQNFRLVAKVHNSVRKLKEWMATLQLDGSSQRIHP